MGFWEIALVGDEINLVYEGSEWHQSREKEKEFFEKLSDIEVSLSFPFSALNPLMFRGEDCKMLIWYIIQGSWMKILYAVYSNEWQLELINVFQKQPHH